MAKSLNHQFNKAGSQQSAFLQEARRYLGAAM